LSRLYLLVFPVVLSIPWWTTPAAQPASFVPQEEWKARHHGLLSNPDLVVLGNSVVGNGVDPAALESALGVRVGTAWREGAGSAWWYLVLKNRILVDPPGSPKIVVLVFTDHLLSAPRYRVDGPWRPALMEHVAGPEPDLWQRAFSAHPAASPGARLEAKLGQWTWTTFERIRFLNQESRRQARFRVNEGLKAALAGGLGLEGPHTIDLAMRTTFSVTTRHRESKSLWMSGVASPLDLGITASFLPLLVEAAQKAGVRLVLVRHKRRRDVVPGQQPAALEQHLASLWRWLDARDVDWVDFTLDPRLTAAHFVDNVHLTEAGRAVFTQMLAESLSDPP
jgi:hypothetical protein